VEVRFERPCSHLPIRVDPVYSSLKFVKDKGETEVLLGLKHCPAQLQPWTQKVAWFSGSHWAMGPTAVRALARLEDVGDMPSSGLPHTTKSAYLYHWSFLAGRMQCLNCDTARSHIVYLSVSCVSSTETAYLSNTSWVLLISIGRCQEIRNYLETARQIGRVNIEVTENEL